ncbi:MAG: hypothetical protein K2P92_05110 [Bdellovibrionaceae bacterium]|nr:hypothetical protein [Pseudobdellovibrionaceae bacterium]
MRTLLFVLGFLLSINVHAAGAYELKVDWSVDGKALQGSVMQVTAGDINTMMQQEAGKKYFLDVTVKEDKAKPGQAQINSTVGEFDKQNKRKILGTPQMIALLGKPAQITTDSTNGPKISVTITIKKK